MSGSRLILLAIAASALLAFGGGKKSDSESYAVIAGTVFRDPGFALPEATVTLSLKTKKLQQAVTTPRGEFSFRVPPTAATYLVKASLKGFKPDEKEAVVAGEDHLDVTLTLVPESK